MPRIPMPRPVPTLRSNTVTLRPPDPQEDARSYLLVNLDPESHAASISHAPSSVQEAQEELERMISQPLISTWMIVANRSQRVVGRFCLCLEERDDGARVVGDGSRIARPHCGKGYEGEARALLLPYIFEELKADWIETATCGDNEDTVLAIETQGFQLFREEAEWNSTHEREVSMRHYVLTNEQWQAPK